jgi:serine phosphatase RsbU (regulator of sigma subunit)
MRLGTRILLWMLLITIGTSAVLAWIVTMNVTRYETRRADQRVSEAIARYVVHVEERHHQVRNVVVAMLEAPALRSQLQAADEAADASAREQLKEEILGRNVQTVLSEEEKPAFHVIVNAAREVVVAKAPDGARLEEVLVSDQLHWPVDTVINTTDRPVTYYVSTPAGLFLAMGVPLHTQFNESPSHAYFVGYRVDDEWIRRQLLSQRISVTSSDAPLSAWFVVDGKIVARASSDPTDPRIAAFSADTSLRLTAHRALAASRSLSTFDSVEFTNAGEHYVGQSFDLRPAEANSGKLVLASSLDQALVPLRNLQKQIVLCTAIACLVAIVACRWIARRIARPIQELLTGTERIAAGQFDEPVRVLRRDELGKLADAFNQMSQGLKERDHLRDERMRIEHDLSLARKIQMDVLPKKIPPCPGYDIAAYSLPAEQTGGDIYDLVALALDPSETDGPSAIVLLLADATGHGVGPALSVTQVRAMLRIGVRLRAELENVFAQMNRQLCQDLGSERFVTAFLGLLDPSSHCVNYHSAGQAPLLHFRARDKHLDWLGPSMVPLGIDEEPQSDGVQRILMEPGDIVVLLTDGFYEFQNGGGDLFSAERVAEVILKHHDQPSKVILTELLTATRAFAAGAPQLDDMTALIVKRLPDSNSEARKDVPAARGFAAQPQSVPESVPVPAPVT